MSTLSIETVSFRYPSGFRLKDVSLHVPARSFLALIGPNGSGKTTLLQLMSGLLQPLGGAISLDGTPLDRFNARQLAKRVAVIPSEQYFEFPFPVAEVVAMGRFPHLGRFDRLRRTDWEKVGQALRVTETLYLKDRPISELSSGERQRVFIARAIAQEPSILMLDEPNAHLDIHHQIAIFQLLQSLTEKQGMTIVLVLHDLTAAAAFCRTLVLLHQGELVKEGTPEEVITADLLRRTYGAEVLVHPSPAGGYPQVSYWRKTDAGFQH